MSLKKTLTALMAAVLLPSTALATVIIQPLHGMGDIGTDMGSFPRFPIEALADQSGLSAGYVSGDDYRTYLNSSPTHLLPAAGSTWVSGTGPPSPTGFIDFALSMPYFLTDVMIWTGSGPQLSRLDEFRILIDGIEVLSGSAVDAEIGGSIAAQSWEFSMIPLLATSVVRLEVVSNSGANANGNFTAISEVAFGGTTTRTVPEPATAALLGLFLFGFGFRKNRSKP